LLDYAQEFGDSERKLAIKGLAIAAGVGAALVLLFVLLMRNKISMAIEVIEASSDAVMDLPLTFIIPVVVAALAVAFVVVWAFILLNILSVTIVFERDVVNSSAFTSITTDAKYLDRKFDESMQNWVYYHAFGLFWGLQFLVYLSYGILSGAVADHYFTARDHNGQKYSGSGIMGSAVLASVWRTIRYHLGTIAFGSLILAVCRAIQSIVHFLEAKTKPQSNCVQRALFTFVNCCVSCVTCFMDKVNRQALI
jgi:hypothetical protein